MCWILHLSLISQMLSSLLYSSALLVWYLLVLVRAPPLTAGLDVSLRSFPRRLSIVFAPRMVLNGFCAAHLEVLGEVQAHLERRAVQP